MRLVEIRGDLGQKLVVAEADRAGHPELAAHPRNEPREHHRRRRPVQPRGAGEVEKRLVERERLHRRGQLEHHRADGARHLRVDLHARADHLGLGAEPQRLEHRHRRAHPADARDVARGRDDPAPPPADDDGLVREIRIVAFLDTGIEGVAIHVRDAQVPQLVMRHDARAATGGAAPGAPELVQAIAAEAGHGICDPDLTSGCKGARIGVAQQALSTPPKGDAPARVADGGLSRPGAASLLRVAAHHREPAQDIDGIGHLVILLAQAGDLLGALALLLDLLALLLGQAVIAEPAAQVRLGPGGAVACASSSSASARRRGWATTISGLTPSAWIERPDGV